MRDKMKQRQLELTLPIMRRIVREGVAEGSFFVPAGDGMAELVLRLGLQLTDEIAFLLSAGSDESDVLGAVVEKLETYRCAIERVLGAPFGSVTLLSVGDLAKICSAMIEGRT